MTKEQALYNFFSGFGLSAFTEDGVPENEPFPYLTYQLYTGNAGDTAISITARLYYYTESEVTPMAKVEEIAQAIGLGGIQIPYDGGSIWVKRGEPWCNSLTVEGNRDIKQKNLNIDLEFL